MRLRELTDTRPVVDDDCVIGSDRSHREQVLLQQRCKLSTKASAVFHVRRKRIDCAAGRYRSRRNAFASVRLLAGIKLYLIQEKTALRQRQTHSFERRAKAQVHVMAGRIGCRESSIQCAKERHSPIIEAPSRGLNVVHAWRTRGTRNEIEHAIVG